MSSRCRSARFSPLTLTELESRDTPASNFVAAGAAAGGTPLVEVFRPDGTTLARFEAFETSFRGGVRAVAAELDGNPDTVEVIAAPGPGGAPRVTVWSVNAATGAVAPLASFFAFDPSFTGGVRVAAGQVSGPSDRDEIIVAADTGGGPRVRVFDLNGTVAVPAGGPLGDFFAFEPGFLGGVRVAAGELDANPTNGDELVVAAGPGGGPRVRTFASNGSVVSDAFALASNSASGVNVAITPTATGGQLQFDGDVLDFSQRNILLNQAAAGAALQSASLISPSAVLGTVFANPTFSTALTSAGLTPTTFFNNGLINSAAFTAPTTFSAFDNAFLSTFGTTAFTNTAFTGAFNALPVLAAPALGSPLSSSLGFGSTGFSIGSPTSFGLGTTSLTGPFVVSDVSVPGSPFSSTVFSPTGPFATTTGTISTVSAPIGATTFVM